MATGDERAGVDAFLEALGVDEVIPLDDTGSPPGSIPDLLAKREWSDRRTRAEPTRSEWDCVLERRRLDDLLNGKEVWHIARHRGRTQDFTPIRCSADEGITLPGPIQRRRPTCVDCLAIVEPES